MSQSASHPNVERVVRAFRERGVEIRVVEFAASTRTAAEAAAVVGVGVAQIAKSLVFLAGEAGEPVLVIASGVNRVSEEKLAALVDGAVRRADADTVKRITGFAVGGVAPVGHASPVRVLLDRDLLRYPEVWAAAGTPHHNFAIAPADLVRVSGGTVADVREESAAAG